MTAQVQPSVTAGLSCYTAALHGYLAQEWDATAVLARSVRLAVRAADTGVRLAFSHHYPPLDLLPDRSRLVYAGAGSGLAALPGIAAELERHGRVIVVADSARLPWSVQRGGPASPHWLLVTDRAARGWWVVDDFTALQSAGEQLPYRGWLEDSTLAGAMTLPPGWPQPAHRLRNTLAFGAPVPVPQQGALWLRRQDGPADGRSLDRDAGWQIGEAAALAFLIQRAGAHQAVIAEHLDDLWAVAGHQWFACRWELGQPVGDAERARLEAALTRWSALPRVLRMAVDSAARGRPRTSLVLAALAGLAEVANR
ncbi:MAG: hypothetical protein ACR2N4_15020 [Jatrophihabitans sp.]